MKFAKWAVLYIEHDHPELDVLTLADMDELRTWKAVIVWKCRGAYKLIPATVLYNNYTATQAMTLVGTYCPRATTTRILISWDQGINISPEVARALIPSSIASQA